MSSMFLRDKLGQLTLSLRRQVRLDALNTDKARAFNSSNSRELSFWSQSNETRSAHRCSCFKADRDPKTPGIRILLACACTNNSRTVEGRYPMALTDSPCTATLTA